MGVVYNFLGGVFIDFTTGGGPADPGINYRFLNGPPPSAPFPDCGGEAESECVTTNC